MKEKVTAARRGSGLAWVSIAMAAGAFGGILLALVPPVLRARKEMQETGISAFSGGIPDFIFWLILLWTLLGVVLGLMSLFRRGSSKILGIIAIGLNLLYPVVIATVLRMALR